MVLPEMVYCLPDMEAKLVEQNVNKSKKEQNAVILICFIKYILVFNFIAIINVLSCGMQ